ncbi:MAG: hypothetical protein ACUVT7_03115 [Thermoplasmata archaeon]
MSILYALGMFQVSSYAATEEGKQRFNEIVSAKFAETASTLFFSVGLVLLILGMSALWLSRGYYRGYESARRRGRTVAVLGIAVSLLGSMFLPDKLAPSSPGWTILLNAVVFVYLGRPRVKAFFSAHPRR